MQYLWNLLYGWADGTSNFIAAHLIIPEDPWLTGFLIVGTTATLLILSYYDAKLIPGTPGEIGPVRFHLQFFSSDLSIGARPDSPLYRSCKVGTGFGRDLYFGWGPHAVSPVGQANNPPLIGIDYPSPLTLFRIGMEVNFNLPTPPMLVPERRLYPRFLQPEVDAGQLVLDAMGQQVGYSPEPVDPTKRERFEEGVMARARRVEEEVSTPLDNTNFPINSPYEEELDLLPPSLLLLLLLIRLWAFWGRSQPARLWIRYLLLPRLRSKLNFQ